MSLLEGNGKSPRGKKWPHVVCVVCKPAKNSLHDNRRFFKFPKESDRSSAWVAACRGNMHPKVARAVEAKSPKSLYDSFYRVCSLHFQDHNYCTIKRHYLNQSAIPTIFKNPDTTAVQGLSLSSMRAALGKKLEQYWEDPLMFADSSDSVSSGEEDHASGVRPKTIVITRWPANGSTEKQDDEDTSENLASPPTSPSSESLSSQSTEQPAYCIPCQKIKSEQLQEDYEDAEERRHKNLASPSSPSFESVSSQFAEQPAYIIPCQEIKSEQLQEDYEDAEETRHKNLASPPSSPSSESVSSQFAEQSAYIIPCQEIKSEQLQEDYEDAEERRHKNLASPPSSPSSESLSSQFAEQPAYSIPCQKIKSEQLQEDNENTEERKHREKMQRWDRFLGLMERLVDVIAEKR